MSGRNLATGQHLCQTMRFYGWESLPHQCGYCNAECISGNLSGLAVTAHKEPKIFEIPAKHGGRKASRHFSAVGAQDAWTCYILLLPGMLTAVAHHSSFGVSCLGRSHLEPCQQTRCLRATGSSEQYTMVVWVKVAKYDDVRPLGAKYQLKCGREKSDILL
jgi:hypothetical protein